jgi:transcriptional regulator with PAS, ATPase and Fis domain
LIALGDARSLGTTRAVVRVSESLEIGRLPIGDPDKVWVLDDDRASRRHALVEVEADRARITDLGSRNGTLVDGVRFKGATASLVPGSMVCVGRHAAIFRYAALPDLEAIAGDLADPFTPVATTSPELARKTRMLRTLAKGQEDLLLIGETGVGKEQFAQAIHRASGRSGKFVPVNCAALPATLVESELFGYVKGAHSQAARDKTGLIADADGGTLLLDEFAEIPQEVQAKLLRFLEDRELQALGATRRRKVDVKIVAATNREVDTLRRDIAARFGPEPIRLPPLREHREDIAALASHFLSHRPGMGLSLRAFYAICLHDWPDNVRGLKKALGRAADLAAADNADVIDVEHLPEAVMKSTSASPGSESAEQNRPSTHPSAPALRRSPRAAPTQDELAALLERHGWVVAHVARELDRDQALVWRWIKRYGLDANRTRSSG